MYVIRATSKQLRLRMFDRFVGSASGEVFDSVRRREYGNVRGQTSSILINIK